MDFITPHAILLEPKNFNKILQEVYVPGGVAQLSEAYSDVYAKDEVQFVVAHRTAQGIGTWLIYTEEELHREFEPESLIPFWTSFGKLPKRK